MAVEIALLSVKEMILKGFFLVFFSMSNPRSFDMAVALTALPPFPITIIFELLFLQASKYLLSLLILLRSILLKMNFNF